MSVARAAAAVARIYRRPEPRAHYDWRLGVLTAVAVGSPLVAGQLSDRLTDGVIAALAAWFLGLMVGPASVDRRAFEYGRRVVVCVAATALGVALTGRPTLVAAALAVLAVFIPAPGMTITPLICLLMGLNTPPGMSAGGHVVAFAAGAAWAAVVFLHPWAASPVARLPDPDRTLGDAVIGHLRTRTAHTHYAFQVAVILPATFLVLTALRWTHAPWVLIGILTTLRSTWDATRARVVKRSIGMVAGSALTAGALLAAHLSVWASIAMITAYGAAARPFRQYNYGYWPIFGTPVLLLLVDLTEPLRLVDSAWRLGNNLLGALLALATVTLLWPHPDQSPWRARREAGAT